MKKYFLTTPIYYANAFGHIGHAYTNIAADAVSRFKKLQGFEVFFLTGTDEHGAKVEDAAKAAGKEPKEFVDEIAEDFKKKWKNLNISFDYFVRTTDKRHEEAVEYFLNLLKEKGFVFSGKYSGLYCKGCERFILEKELVNGKCPDHLTEPIRLEEENYFFKLSEFQAKVLDLIEKDQYKIEPRERKNEVASFLKKEKLQDIAISRPALTWGVKIPWDKKHSCYVWIDALLNYVSAVGFKDNKKEFEKIWPADLHLIAKDILRFHAVIWPAMLLAVGLQPPKRLFVHGYFTVNSQKMSKSLGNSINPDYLVQKYGSDAVRYYLFREIPFGQDGDFSEKSLIERNNQELANELGNLFNRTIVLVEKKLGGKIPKSQTSSELQKRLNLEKIEQHIESLELHSALAEIFSFVKECNKFVNSKEPWRLEGKQLEEVLYSLADALRITAILVSPFIPQTSEEMNSQLGTKAGTWKDCKFNLLKAGTQVKKGKILFEKISS